MTPQGYARDVARRLLMHPTIAAFIPLSVRSNSMRRQRTVPLVIAGLVLLLRGSQLPAADETVPALGPVQKSAIDAVNRLADEILSVNRSIWEFAEVGLEEHRSSALLVDKLKAAGFRVRTGLADMPTAFVAEFGEGKPVIGLLCEYDALPGLSQKLSPDRDPVKDGAPGHGCGHSGLGAGTLGAALAVKAMMEQHRFPGTIRLYGTPAEETVIGKVYMTLAGDFRDLDTCLHFHPSTRNESWSGSSKAAVSVKFTFHGTAAHAAGSPEKGRSALDAVELMNVGANFMREHIKGDARIHYVITEGGGAPNVVPAKATVWYYIRADDHRDVEEYFRWVNDIAKGAALMSRTKFDVQVDTDCHEIIPNTSLSELVLKNLKAVGAPKFTDADRVFARRLQEPLIAEFNTKFPDAIDEKIYSLVEAARPAGGSTDVGDVSWHIPTGGLRTSCMAAESPGHSWQNVAAIASPIGEKGILYASKVLAVTMIDLLQNPAEVAAAKAEFDKRMKDRPYTTLIPKGQKAPKKIR